MRLDRISRSARSRARCSERVLLAVSDGGDEAFTFPGRELLGLQAKNAKYILAGVSGHRVLGRGFRSGDKALFGVCGATPAPIKAPDANYPQKEVDKWISRTICGSCER